MVISDQGDVIMYKGIVSIFSKLEDPRKGNAIVHDLVETLIVAVLAVLCGAQAFTETELFGNTQFDWLKTFLKLKHGIPSHDTFGDIFAALEPSQITSAFAEWVETIRAKISGEVVALDGKTIRASADAPKQKRATHVISAWAAQNRLVLGQIATDQKSDEITAIPKILDLLKLKDCIATIDAMGTQAKIAEAIIAKEADYILTVKENQPLLYGDIKSFFDHSANTSFESAVMKEKSHGRLEERTIKITRDIAWLDPEHKWVGLSGIAELYSRTENLTTGKNRRQQYT
jgi:predicted transposase YbfD/YdcC